MPSVYQLKTGFQNLLRPICKFLASVGVTANQVTITAAILSVAMGITIFNFPFIRWIYFILPAFLIFRMGLNAIDGMLAREHNMKSPLGAILNELGDVVSDATIYLAFVAVPILNPYAVVSIVILAIFSEFAGVVAVQIGASRKYEGPMGKSDRAFWFGLLSLALAFNLNISGWINYALWAICGLTGLTILNRCRAALKELSVNNKSHNNSQESTVSTNDNQA